MDSAEVGPVELRPSELERWASVRVATLLQLPESNARAFMIAASIGSILDENGTTNKLDSGQTLPSPEGRWHQTSPAVDGTVRKRAGDRGSRVVSRYLGTPPDVRWYMVDEWEGAKQRRSGRDRIAP